MGLLKYNKVYVMAPYHYSSGGPELAHQLVDYLRNKGEEAYIIYAKDRKLVTTDLTVTENFKKYNIEVSGRIEYTNANVIVLPEIYLYMIPKLKNIQVCIWWMSVDMALGTNANSNFLETFRFKKGLLDKLRVVKHIRSYKNRYSFNKLKKEDYRLTHFYQATYIQQFLYGLGLNRVIRLSDFINPEILNHVDGSKAKEDIILYNPSKGIRYTKRLMKHMPGYRFIALKGFTREQLNNLFDTAKLYIDLGEFPGKDRLPREAAIHNCCIITGKFGASRYYEDVPIDSKYKFDMLHANYADIKNCIDDILENYDTRIKDFEYLRETIKHERENFYHEIDNIFF